MVPGFRKPESTAIPPPSLRVTLIETPLSFAVSVDVVFTVVTTPKVATAITLTPPQ